MQRGLGNASCGGEASLPKYSIQKTRYSHTFRLSPAHREIESHSQYCSPSGTYHAEEKAYVAEINTTNAETNLNYKTSAFPGKVHVELSDTIVSKQGKKFTLNLIGNIAGPKDAVHQDLRYNVAAIFADGMAMVLSAK